jgi:hypothetical protein
MELHVPEKVLPLESIRTLNGSRIDTPGKSRWKALRIKRTSYANEYLLHEEDGNFAGHIAVTSVLSGDDAFIFDVKNQAILALITRYRRPKSVNFFTPDGESLIEHKMLVFIGELTLTSGNGKNGFVFGNLAGQLDAVRVESTSSSRKFDVIHRSRSIASFVFQCSTIELSMDPTLHKLESTVMLGLAFASCMLLSI